MQGLRAVIRSSFSFLFATNINLKIVYFMQIPLQKIRLYQSDASSENLFMTFK